MQVGYTIRCPVSGLAQHGTNIPTMSQMDDKDVLTVKLEVLRSEHRALDDEIAGLTEGARGNSLLLQRFKRQKLRLKDEIARISDRLTPDIIA